MVRVTPVQYNPVDSELVVHSQIIFKITFEYTNEETDADERTPLNTPLLKRTLPRIVANPAIFEEAQHLESSSTDPGYLIVTTPEFGEAADSLAKWKSQMGYRVFTVAPSNWTGSDQVKDTIHYYASEHDLDFFIIIGDHEQVPSELVNTADSLHVTDLYYACLDGRGDFTRILFMVVSLLRSE